MPKSGSTDTTNVSDNQLDSPTSRQTMQNVHNVVQEELDFLVEVVLNNVKHLRSIMLVGSFATGEGAVGNIDGDLIPLNDYDIYMIGDEPITTGQLEEVASLCSQRLKSELRSPVSENLREEKIFLDLKRGFRVDAHFMTPRQLGSVPPLIRYWEMRQSARVLWGEDARVFIRDIKQEQIPYGEGIRFICNQLVALVGTWGTIDPKPYHYYASKAWTAYATALLLLTRQLRPTYRERADRFGEVFSRNYRELRNVLPTLADDIAANTAYKIEPDFSPYCNGKTVDEQLVALWFKTRDTGLVVMEYYLNRWLGCASLKKNLDKLRHHYYTPYLQDAFPYGSYLNVPIQLFLNLRYSWRLLWQENKLYFPLSWVSPDIQLWRILPDVLTGLPQGKLEVKDVRRIPYPIESERPSEPREVQKTYLKAYDLARKVREVQSIPFKR